MRRRGYPSLHHESEVDLIPMMDLALNLTFFFVVLTTLVQDEATRGVTLPLSSVAFRAAEAQIPDSISVNVSSNGTVMSWGTELSLRSPADLQTLDGLLGMESARARAASSDPNKKIVDTTVILRVDEDADCGDFQRLMDACRDQGFRKFILRTRAEDR